MQNMFHCVIKMCCIDACSSHVDEFEIYDFSSTLIQYIKYILMTYRQT